MTKTILCYTFLVAFWLLLILSFEEQKSVWGQINIPDSNYEVVLYQKNRIMHQAPEILVYFKKRGSMTSQAIGNILLPEDDRNHFSYDYEWTKGRQLKLKLICNQCMINQRHYKITLGPRPSLVACEEAV